VTDLRLSDADLDSGAPSADPFGGIGCQYGRLRSGIEKKGYRGSSDLRSRRSRLCAARRGRSLHRRTQHRPGGKLPLNTNGGGLSYMHSGMYGMYALQESVRQMRGIAPAQIPGAKISVCHGVGGMFAASGTIIMSNGPP
jgi:hypothetical protein